MKNVMIVGSLAALLLVSSVAPAIAAGPPWAQQGGPAVQRPVRGPGAGGIGLSIPAEVHTAIHNATVAAAARTLKMTPQALQQELAAGKTIATVAVSKNVPVETVLAAMATARKGAVDQALKAKKITQAQADWLLRAGPRVATAPQYGTRPVGPRGGMYGGGMYGPGQRPRRGRQ